MPSATARVRVEVAPGVLDGVGDKFAHQEGGDTLRRRSPRSRAACRPGPGSARRSRVIGKSDGCGSAHDRSSPLRTRTTSRGRGASPGRQYPIRYSMGLLGTTTRGGGASFLDRPRGRATLERPVFRSSSTSGRGDLSATGREAGSEQPSGGRSRGHKLNPDRHKERLSWSSEGSLPGVGWGPHMDVQWRRGGRRRPRWSTSAASTGLARGGGTCLRALRLVTVCDCGPWWPSALQAAGGESASRMPARRRSRQHMSAVRV